MKLKTKNIIYLLICLQLFTLTLPSVNANVPDSISDEIANHYDEINLRVEETNTMYCLFSSIATEKAIDFTDFDILSNEQIDNRSIIEYNASVEFSITVNSTITDELAEFGENDYNMYEYIQNQYKLTAHQLFEKNIAFYYGEIETRTFRSSYSFDLLIDITDSYNYTVEIVQTKHFTVSKTIIDSYTLKINVNRIFECAYTTIERQFPVSSIVLIAGIGVAIVSVVGVFLLKKSN